MRRAYDEFYVKSPNASYYLQGRGYTIEDFERIVSEVAGKDMSEFFSNHIRGTEDLPWAQAFGAVGLQLLKISASQPYTGGIVIDPQDRQALRLGTLRPDSPAERAGLQQGDILVSIGGVPVSRENWSSVLNRFRQGDRIPISVRRFRQTVELTIQLGAPEKYVYRIAEDPNASAESKGRRAMWLNQ
jgi:predicted metalloprotease with PDZ domain